MGKRVLNILSLSFFISILLGLGFKSKGKIVKLDIPKYWPKTNYDFEKKPLTTAKIELGRHLFYDPILSLDTSISCASCHSSYTAFTHIDHPLSHGIGDSVGTRNSPVLINLAWNTSFMWDGSIPHIENQVLAPIHNSVEMGDDIVNVVRKLQSSEKYKALFNYAFGDTIITGQHVLIAIAQFELTLVSSNSKYDKIIQKVKHFAFSEQEQRGYDLFKTNCASCHKEPLFTSGEFENNGLPLNDKLNDYGRVNVTQNPLDSFKFKVPTLRNIEFSFPYMHDGRFNSLFEVIDHYTSEIKSTSVLAPPLKGGLKLTHENKIDIISFLLTLTDKDFLFNPKFTFPRKNN